MSDYLAGSTARPMPRLSAKLGVFNTNDWTVNWMSVIASLHNPNTFTRVSTFLDDIVGATRLLIGSFFSVDVAGNVNSTTETTSFIQNHSNQSIGGHLAIGGELQVTGATSFQAVRCGALTCDSISVAGLQRVACIVYIASVAYPVIRSVSDTSSLFGSINLSAVMGVTGNATPFLVYPGHRLLFLASNGMLLAEIDNSSGIDLLLANASFSCGVVCTRISVLLNNIQI